MIWLGLSTGMEKTDSRGGGREAVAGQKGRGSKKKSGVIVIQIQLLHNFMEPKMCCCKSEN